jgi:hypothetical protein
MVSLFSNGRLCFTGIEKSSGAKPTDQTPKHTVHYYISFSHENHCLILDSLSVHDNMLASDHTYSIQWLLHDVVVQLCMPGSCRYCIRVNRINPKSMPTNIS